MSLVVAPSPVTAIAGAAGTTQDTAPDGKVTTTVAAATHDATVWEIKSSGKSSPRIVTLSTSATAPNAALFAIATGLILLNISVVVELPATG